MKTKLPRAKTTCGPNVEKKFAMASLARSMTSSAFLNGKNTYFFVVCNRSFAAANAVAVAVSSPSSSSSSSADADASVSPSMSAFSVFNLPTHSRIPFFSSSVELSKHAAMMALLATFFTVYFQSPPLKTLHPFPTPTFMFAMPMLIHFAVFLSSFPLAMGAMIPLINNSFARNTASASSRNS